MNSLVQDARKAAERVGLKSDTIVINGGRPLRGTIDVRGAKNLVTKAMVASLLGDTTSTLRDVPDISDVHVVASLLEIHGVKITGSAATGVLQLDP
ncbi:MAG: UDP-N-acetylglucosamine 1-carboxyvinyltransferase, partial [Herbiconiux sp.]|nr:UDP-N-acetylglucosamine 1-carboxyvinyltransferase [Herbiconiux sp.]